jgi:peptidyl-prolyl cis-trans isomerase SurA
VYRKSILLLSCAVVTGFAAAALAQDAAPITTLAPATVAPDAAPITTLEPAAVAPAETPAADAAPTTNPAAPPDAAAPLAPVIGDHNTQAVASIVNDYLITDFDVNQRTALFLATSGIARPAPEALAQIRQQVQRALEDETLQLQEASKRKITIKKAEVDSAVEQVAKDNNMTVEQLTGTLRQAGVSMNTFRNQLTAQIAWNRLVEARYAGSINITDEQVDAALDRLKEGANRPQFQVAEIFLSVDRPQDDDQIRSDAEQLVQQIKLGANFQNVARQFSRAPSAASGGNIGWVPQGQLAAELDKALNEMHPGDVSAPIKAEGGYYVLMVLDRREPVGTKPVEAPKLDPNGPLPLERLLLPLPPDAPEDLRKQAIGFAESVRTTIKSCRDVVAITQQAQGAPRDPYGGAGAGNRRRHSENSARRRDAAADVRCRRRAVRTLRSGRARSKDLRDPDARGSDAAALHPAADGAGAQLAARPQAGRRCRSALTARARSSSQWESPPGSARKWRSKPLPRWAVSFADERCGSSAIRTRSDVRRTAWASTRAR